MGPIHSVSPFALYVYTEISVIRNQEIRRHVPFLNWKPHTKYMGPDPHTKSMTHTNCVKCHTKCMGVTQNVWAPYLTMRHFLLESFVWEEAIHVPFLRRGVSYD